MWIFRKSARTLERISRIHKGIRIYSLYFSHGREIAWFTSKWIREREREREISNKYERERELQIADSSERASFIGSVWMQFGRPWLRVSEGPRNIDHSALLKDSTKVTYWDSLYASASRLCRSPRALIREFGFRVEKQRYGQKIARSV